MNPQNIALFAILGSIGAFWAQIKNFLIQFFSFFIRTDEIEHYEVAANLIRNLLKEGKIIHWGNVTYKSGYREWLKKFECNYDYLFLFRKEFLIKYKRTLIKVKSDNGKSLKVTYLFGTFNLHKHLEEAYLEGINSAKSWQAKQHKRFYITQKGGREDIAPNNPRATNTPESIPQPSIGNENVSLFAHFGFLKENNKYLLINHKDIGRENNLQENSTYYWQPEGLKLKTEVEFWLKNRQWFEDRGLRWFRGAILFSKPGTGKTKAALEVARAVDVPIFKFDISTMSNGEFTREWESVEYGSIVLIEDIDSTFKGRENLHAKPGLEKQLLTFDYFINTINGVRETSGIFLILTTNFIENLDKAAIRAGRCDLKIEFGPLDIKGRKFIAANILKDWPEEQEVMVRENEGLTVVEFQNKVIERAIELFNSQNGKISEDKS